MTAPPATATTDPAQTIAVGDPVAAATALMPQIQAARDEIEDNRSLPVDLVASMAAANLFQLGLPKSAGGPEHDPLTSFQAIEALARADGSVGWCASIASSVSVTVGGWLPAEILISMFGAPPDARIAGSVRPEGTALEVGGGYLVSGRWDFASGIEHANWLFCSCKISDGNGPKVNENGVPQVRTLMVPRSSATRIDTWVSAGMRGSGSHDFEIKDVFVRSEYTLSTAAPPHAHGLIYHPRLTRICSWTHTAGVALGIARGALDALSELGTRKTSMTTTPLRQRPEVQTAAGQGEAILGAARAYLFHTVVAAFDAIEASAADPQAPDPGPAVARARLAITHSMHEAVRCVDILFHAAGTLSVYRRNVIERCFRDVHVARQHAAAMPVHFQTAGKATLGFQLNEPGW